MTTPVYIDNFTPGSATSPYDTWAKAGTLLSQIDAADAAGDVIYFDSRHNEAPSAPVTYNIAGSQTTPSKLLSVTQATPPTALTAGAKIAPTGAGGININGSFYAYGFTIVLGTGQTSGTLSLWLQNNTTSNNSQIWEDSQFQIAGTGINMRVTLGVDGNPVLNRIRLIKPEFKFANASQRINVLSGNHEIKGLSINSGSTALTSELFTFGGSTGRGGSLIITGADLTYMGSTCNIFGSLSTSSGIWRAIIRDVKLPASWTGDIYSGNPAGLGQRVEMYNADTGTKNYRLWIKDYFGSLVEETVKVKTSGATEGGQAISWKITTTANASFPTNSFDSIEIPVEVTSTGSKTFTIEILVDSASAWNTNDITLEIDALESSAQPLATYTTTAPSVLASTTALTAGVGTGSWTTTGLTNPISYKLTVTRTINMSGFAILRVRMFKASATAYIDRVVTVS